MNKNWHFEFGQIWVILRSKMQVTTNQVLWGSDRLFELTQRPLKGFYSWHSALLGPLIGLMLPEQNIYKDPFRCVAIDKEIPGHHQVSESNIFVSFSFTAEAEDDGATCHHETLYALLNTISPAYTNSFGEALSEKLSRLQWTMVKISETAWNVKLWAKSSRPMVQTIIWKRVTSYPRICGEKCQKICSRPTQKTLLWTRPFT